MNSASPPLGVPTDSVMNLALLGKTALALAVVLGCVLVFGWLARRMSTRALVPGKQLRVVSSTGLGQREKVVIVEVRGQWLVLGVTAQQVTALAQMDAPEVEPEAVVAGGFAERLANALTGKGRAS